MYLKSTMIERWPARTHSSRPHTKPTALEGLGSAAEAGRGPASEPRSAGMEVIVKSGSPTFTPGSVIEVRRSSLRGSLKRSASWIPRALRGAVGARLGAIAPGLDMGHGFDAVVVGRPRSCGGGALLSRWTWGPGRGGGRGGAGGGGGRRLFWLSE